ncbi:MAG TPA: cell wall hydrolase [Patescibacteria group bacterium]|nr:cell wall hydrolase [Patescibacteria group bacterium]
MMTLAALWASPAGAPPLAPDQARALAVAMQPPPSPQPAPPPKPAQQPRQAVSGNEMRCLATTIYWESGSEPVEGQLAVAHVVLNRVGQPGFAKTICGVVQQGGKVYHCQFKWYCSGRDTTPRDPAMWDGAQRAAQRALGERDPTDGAMFFHQAALGPQKWAKGRYNGARVIGRHIFFRGRP